MPIWDVMIKRTTATLLGGIITLFIITILERLIHERHANSFLIFVKIDNKQMNLGDLVPGLIEIGADISGVLFENYNSDTQMFDLLFVLPKVFDKSDLIIRLQNICR